MTRTLISTASSSVWSPASTRSGSTIGTMPSDWQMRAYRAWSRMLDSMASCEGLPAATSTLSGERHLANTQPFALYSRSRSARESRPCITVSPSQPGSLYTCNDGLTPGRMPRSVRTCGSGTPELDVWKTVSGSRIAAEMNSVAPSASKSIWRYARRLSSVGSTPTLANLGSIVRPDSSHAEIPFPGCPMCWTTASRDALVSGDRNSRRVATFVPMQR
mmetsp:Transcript_38977/g.102190  ORF Transcript_38977/g.102190 Transcript_38977/m.102190 type:complete len:218 (+) Transcript_38977:1009-1662(+)